jgi:hypothetical protein
MAFPSSFRAEDVKGDKKTSLLLFRSLLPRVTILYTPVVPSINRKESLVLIEEEDVQKGNFYIGHNLMCRSGSLQKIYTFPVKANELLIYKLSYFRKYTCVSDLSKTCVLLAWYMCSLLKQRRSRQMSHFFRAHITAHIQS